MSAIFRFTAAGALVASFLTLPAFAATERAYIGTYTAESSQRHGEGIYLADLDTATGMVVTFCMSSSTP